MYIKKTTKDDLKNESKERQKGRNEAKQNTTIATTTGNPYPGPLTPFDFALREKKNQQKTKQTNKQTNKKQEGGVGGMTERRNT